MGFGSYDESEQENQDVDISDSEGESLNRTEEGEVNFEITDTDELMEKFKEVQS